MPCPRLLSTVGSVGRVHLEGAIFSISFPDTIPVPPLRFAIHTPKYRAVCRWFFNICCMPICNSVQVMNPCPLSAFWLRWMCQIQLLVPGDCWELPPHTGISTSEHALVLPWWVAIPYHGHCLCWCVAFLSTLMCYRLQSTWKSEMELHKLAGL